MREESADGENPGIVARGPAGMSTWLRRVDTRRFLLVRLPITFGFAAASALLGVYLTVVGLVQGWSSAVRLLGQDAYLTVPLVLGFGIQVALFSHLRILVRGRARGTGALTGASGGTSAAAMAACCAHRVADFLPFLGLSAAAGLLAAWKVPLMIVGVAFSVVGIAVILKRIVDYRNRQSPEEVS